MTDERMTTDRNAEVARLPRSNRNAKSGYDPRDQGHQADRSVRARQTCGTRVRFARRYSEADAHVASPLVGAREATARTVISGPVTKIDRFGCWSTWSTSAQVVDVPKRKRSQVDLEINRPWWDPGGTMGQSRADDLTFSNIRPGDSV